MITAAAMLLPATIQAEVKIEPAGMKIVWKSLKDDFDGFQTYNSSKGTYVSLALRAGEKGIIAFDKDKSKINISDGTSDLGGKFGMWNKISKSGKVMRVEVTTEKLPAAGTQSLELTGSINATVASNTDTKASEAREFKKGDKVELTDDFKFEISKIEKPKWGDDPLSVTLKWSRKIPELAAVRFYDAEGKEIESKSGGSSWGGFLGKYSVTKSYRLKRKSKVLKIEMDLWTDAETINVPIKLKMGLHGGQ
ncbi:MAG: hypothetical protein KJO79_04690 [Verrucomicrobiae bacterium]|nr:hypothetical protein [Verrucomicrobiae bacterium]NNJ86454.1 hypothetical protein [Akkermansiaceae bacterium]